MTLIFQNRELRSPRTIIRKSGNVNPSSGNRHNDKSARHMSEFINTESDKITRKFEGKNQWNYAFKFS